MANRARPSWLARWSEAHLRVLFFSLGKLWQQPVASLLTAAVVGVTLALPAALHVLLNNINAVSYSWESTLQASLFLKDSVAQARGETLATEIAQWPAVSHAGYISRAQSLAEFRELSGFGQALDTLNENPLPAVIVVTPKPASSREQVTALIYALGQLPEVELAKLDQQWLERLYAVLEIVRRAIALIAAMLALAVVVIVGNTIRLDIENRREEIVVMKLIGAPDGFIRRPFLYTGLWYGLAGAVIACVLVEVTVLALSGPSRRLAGLYGSSFHLSGLTSGTAASVFAAGVLLGWAGAFWTVTRHLGKFEPT